MPTIRKRGAYQWQAVIRRRGYPDTCKTFNTRREAEAWASVVESEIARGVFVSRIESESTTLGEALERYWNEIRSKMRNACRDEYQHKRWLAHPLSIVKMVLRTLEETGCRPEWLELEITESVVMENPEAATETLHRLSAMGVHLSIDDFGTGYSSLSYLKRFPIDALKIDKSFVRDITIDADDAAIAKAVIALAHSLKLSVIAEGVEAGEQLDFLRAQECNIAQGYYLSRPLPVEKFELFMRESK